MTAPKYSLRFERLVRKIAAARDLRVWTIVHLLSQANALKKAERHMAATSIALALVRQRRLLEVAAELLDEAAAGGPVHLVLEGQARLAEVRGELKKANALRRLAAEAPDAPDAAEVLRSEWASQEIHSRKRNSSSKGRRQRLDAYFKAIKKLEHARE